MNAPRVRSVCSVGGAVTFLIVLVAALPWLRGEEPARTILRARFTARGDDPEAVAALRRELDLPDDPVEGAMAWIGGVLRGDLGESWRSGRPVIESVGPALQTSAVLGGGAMVVALLLAVLLLAGRSWPPYEQVGRCHDAWAR